MMLLRQLQNSYMDSFMVNSDDTDVKVANITPFGLRLQPALKRRVEEAAKASGRSLNAEIAARLEASFQDGPLPGDDYERRISILEKTVFNIVMDERLNDLANEVADLKASVAKLEK